MRIETPKKNLKIGSEQIFNFLTDAKNFKKLMPENIDKFELLDENTFRFALKGMPEIVLRIKEKLPNSKVILGAASSKLAFSLHFNIDEQSEESSDVSLHFEGKFNALTTMMIKKPITNFLNTLSNNMKEIG